jgi:DNA-binding response OmpR family regulator
MQTSCLREGTIGVCSKQIMVVDDEVGVRQLLGIMLERAGFSVIKAGDASEALDLLQSTDPDLFILDVMMPGMNGLELCQHIRQSPKTTHTPVLILSAKADVEDIQRGLSAGANEYVVKPVLPRDLVSKVSAALQKP